MTAHPGAPTAPPHRAQGRPAPSTYRMLTRAVWAGHEPAESLPTAERRALFVQMRDVHGWSLQRIADHTRTSLYTVARVLADADRTAAAVIEQYAAVEVA